MGRVLQGVGTSPAARTVRKRYRKLAFTPSNGRNSIRVDGPNVRLPRIGWVRLREELRFEGDILSVSQPDSRPLVCVVHGRASLPRPSGPVPTSASTWG